MGNESGIFWGLIFGSIGLGYFVYGKKQNRVIPLFCGLGLMAFPYMVTNTLLLVSIGLVIMAIPYFVRL